MTWTTTKQMLIAAIDEVSAIIRGELGPKLEGNHAEDGRYGYPARLTLLSLQIGKLRSLVDHLPEDNTVKRLCNNCNHLSNRGYKLDPLGNWGYCILWGKDVLEDTYSCRDWTERDSTWPPEKGEDDLF